MSATILTFPGKKKSIETVYRVPLYTDPEVDTVITCVNVFNMDSINYNYESITKADPLLVIQCLSAALESNIFSAEFKKIVDSILENVEVVDHIK